MTRWIRAGTRLVAALACAAAAQGSFAAQAATSTAKQVPTAATTAATPPAAAPGWCGSGKTVKLAQITWESGALMVTAMIVGL